MTWRERLNEMLEQGRKPTVDEVKLATKWETCAVGEQHQLHPEVVFYTKAGTAPLDRKLADLGVDFIAHLVLDDDISAIVSGADSVLDAIEDRVMELKREHVGSHA